MIGAGVELEQLLALPGSGIVFPQFAVVEGGDEVGEMGTEAISAMQLRLSTGTVRQKELRGLRSLDVTGPNSEWRSQ